MKAEFEMAINSSSLTLKELLDSKPTGGEKRMLVLAVRHNSEIQDYGVGAEIRRLTTNLGYWPKVYAEAMILNRPQESMDDRLLEFVQGIVVVIDNCKRNQRHIPFHAAILMWESLRETGHVSQVTAKEMLSTLIDEFARRPHFQATLADLLCLHEKNKVKGSQKVMPTINAYLLANPVLSAAMFKPLKASFLKAMNTFAPEVWMPHCKGPERVDMRLGRDLGL
ncbi:hypothetical protein IFT69_18490 [Pseudomonas putida]|nr:hypothetical protein [Pseudomonas putida]